MRKKRRVPVVLWRLFGDRALTLSATITSFIPQSHPTSFLLQQPRDPSDYIKLLNHSYVVLDSNAPPFAAAKFPPSNHWPQHEIVVRTIEMMVREQSTCNHSSPIVELLTSSAWSLLLERIGDDTMVYLLKHTSIFLPLPPKKHCQVAGPPVNSLALKLMKNKAEPRHQDPLVNHFGHKKKRDRVDDANSLSDVQQFNPLCVMGCVGCVSCSGSFIKPSGSHLCNNKGQIDVLQAAAPMYEVHLNEELVNMRKRSRPFKWERCKKRKHSDISESSSTPISRHPVNRCCQMSILEAASPTTGACTVNYEGFPIEKLPGLNQVMAKAKHKKHSRLFRWQRNKKRRHSDVEEASATTSYLMNCIEEDTAPERLQSDLNNIKIHSPDKMPQQCPCCLVLQDALLVTKGAQINRQPIFYSSERSSSVLPRKHLLNSLKPNFSGSKTLFGSIFGLSNVNARAPSVLCSHSSSFCLLGSACLYHSLIKFLKTLIRRNRCCKHLHLLDKHCAVPSLTQAMNQNASSLFEKRRILLAIFSQENDSESVVTKKSRTVSIEHCNRTLTSENLQTGAIRSYCSKSQVVSFIWAVCRSLVPPDLLEKWIFWFFSFLVVPLLQANFYVTESEHGKQDVFYYRKPIWEKLKNTTITGLKDQNYQHLDPSEVKSIIGNRLFGFSKLRLRPKENGARMLVNLKAPSRMLVQESSSTGIPGKAQFVSKSVKYKHFKPVNYVLRDTYAVLKGILVKEPEKLGSSVFDYNDIYRKLGLFIIDLKNGLSTIPNVYIVVSDVSKAFDSVNQDQLLSVMKDILHENEYLLQQSSQVVCTKKSLWVHENLTLMDSEIGAGFTKKSSSGRFGSLHSVLINQGLGRYMKKKEILFNLYEHVKCNVLQLDKTFYLQGIGIPQGSVLSSLLCSVYYGHLERNVLFPFIEITRGPTVEDLSRRCNSWDSSAAGNSSEDRLGSSPYILLRLIDDLCFISTSKKQAESFYTRLLRGFRDYNCYMNEEKFCLSFHSGHELALPSNRVYIGEDGISFLRWSGLLLNSCTLEVQADYTRYLNNHLRSTLTVSWQGKPGRHLKAKLSAFMRPKCHPIFFDSNINTGPVVRLNIYQAFLLCAMKFHCYVSEMYICKLRPGFHLKIIERSFRYMYALIKKMMYSARTGSHFHPILQLEAREVEWLGLNAFVKVLKRKQSRHKELLHLLKLKLLAHEINGNVSSQLEYAVDSSHSSVMWKIKY
ncbi:telomerase reverse transcriptase, putative [Ricinus communis]|uniref:Telomerase reverse transcriptase n=1 Tax=Ricinus communis TaxID=3988 RepID=B9RX29_RICCO|nr:telomerase reverse transcriptase, putative [Ricinus communis]